MTTEMHINRLFIEEHQQELVQRYPGKYVVISEGALVGAFDTYEEAREQIAKGNHPLIRQMLPANSINIIAMTQMV